MKKNEFLEMTYAELCQKETELRNELGMLKLRRKIGQIEKTHRMSQVRRDIARLMTEKTKKVDVKE